MGATFLANLSYFIPELIVIITMVALLFIEATFTPKEGHRTEVYWATGIGLFLALIHLLLALKAKPLTVFSGAVTIDSFSTLAKIIMVLATFGVTFLSKHSKDIYLQAKSEFVIMGLGVLVGGMLLASANNLLTIYLGVETLSILSYVLASLKRHDSKSSEAGLKYVLYGGVASGLLLFGTSHIYGVFGTFQFSEIVNAVKSLSGGEVAVLLPSFLFFFAGLGYKISCVPFHMWTPDVYEGSPFPVTTFFAIVPKVAAITALIRVSMVFFPDEGVLRTGWVGVLQLAAALTITVGNVTAIGQRSVKRMLAYSSISHAGMMLLGVIVMNEAGSRAILFYAMTYLFMTLVAFFVASFVSDRYGNDDHDRFKGLIYRYPLMAITLTLVMFSLAGLPPFSGFVAKFHIISVVIKEGYYGLGFIAALNSVISLYYYMRLAKLMVLNEAESVDKIEGFNFTNQSVIILLTVPVLILGVFWEKIMLLADGAKIFIN